MGNLDLKKLLPHFVAIGVFLCLTVAFFSPVLKGYTLNQGDIRNWQGVANEVLEHQEETGETALWTNSLFGGMPAYLISIKYSGNLFNKLHKVFSAGIPQPMGFLLICMLGFYFLMLVLRINPWIALIGAVAFAFSTYFVIIIEAGHNTKLQAIAYMAPFLGSLILTFRGKYLLGGALTGAFLALEISCNHLQITYYLFLIVLIYGAFELVRAIKEKTLPSFSKAVMVAAVAAIIGVGANINRLWGLYEYSNYSTRGKSELTSDGGDKTSGLDKSYATAWSYGMGETWTLLIPNYKGGGSGAISQDNEDALDAVSDPQMKQLIGQLNPYFGDQPFTSGPVYVGAILCFLFVLGLLIVKGNMRWVLLLATILSIMLAWGKNFMGLTEFFLDYVPGYNKFRTVSMTLVIAELTIPALACLALDQIIKNFSKDQMKKVYTAFALTGGMSLLLLVVGQDFSGTGDAQMEQQLLQAGFQQQMIPSVFAELEATREAIFKSDALRSFGLILAAFALVFLFVRGTIKKEILLVGMAVLIIGDMWTVNKRYIDTEKQGVNYRQWVKKKESKVAYYPDAADNAILQDPDPNYRVYNLTSRLDQDSRTSYLHKSLGGYHGAKMKRYQELIDAHLAAGNQSVINMLNTKYFIVNAEQQQQQQQQGRQVQQNPGALGNAWYVQELKEVANADDELAALKDFDPKTTAVADTRFGSMWSTTNYDASGTIKQTSYKPGEWIYQSESKADGLVVFSEIYYPEGMKVTIDNQDAEHFRANYVLRAMVVPAGQHTIKFSFEPDSYYIGEKLSLACSVLLLLALAFAGFKAYKGEGDTELSIEEVQEESSGEE